MLRLPVMLLLVLSLLINAHQLKQNLKNPQISAEEAKIIKRVDELNKQRSIKIYGDIITIEKLDDSETSKNQFKRTEEADPLIAKVDNFFSTKKIQIRLPSDGSAADIFGRALGKKNIDVNLKGLIHGASEARTKLKKLVLPILIALKLKALIELPIVIAIIGLVGFKGLGAGLAALFIAGALALKSIITPPIPYPARVSYGIVKPEIYHEHWHRSQEDINQPYRAWEPDFNIDPYPYPYHSLP